MTNKCVSTENVSLTSIAVIIAYGVQHTTNTKKMTTSVLEAWSVSFNAFWPLKETQVDRFNKAANRMHSLCVFLTLKNVKMYLELKQTTNLSINHYKPYYCTMHNLMKIASFKMKKVKVTGAIRSEVPFIIFKLTRNFHNIRRILQYPVCMIKQSLLTIIFFFEQIHE